MKKLVIYLITALALGCTPQVNTLSRQEKNEGWQLLFDGKSAENFRGVNRDSMPQNGWYIEDGMLIISDSVGGKSSKAGDIITKKEYSSFIFSVDFKLTKGANSGIKYFVKERRKVANNRKSSGLGLEYQLLDDLIHPDAKLYTSFEGSRSLASLYDMKAPLESKKIKTIGEWNTAQIKVTNNNNIEHWLNGEKVLDYNRMSDEFDNLIQGSKYAKLNLGKNNAPFGKAKSGHILLQDHGDKVYFRNIKILILD